MQGVLIVSKNLHSDVRGHLGLTFADNIFVLHVTVVASVLLLGIREGFFSAKAQALVDEYVGT